MKTFWISFADKTGNLGCCIVDAEYENDAIKKTHDLKINPGGQAMFFDLTHRGADFEINKWGKDKLITPEASKNDGYKRLKDVDIITKHKNHARQERFSCLRKTQQFKPKIKKMETAAKEESMLEEYQREYKIGFKTFKQIFKLKRKALIDLIIKICEDKIDDVKRFKDCHVSAIRENGIPHNIHLHNYDRIEIDALGISYKPEHGQKRRVLKFDEFFTLPKDLLPAKAPSHKAMLVKTLKLLDRAYHRIDNKSHGARTLLASIESLHAELKRTGTINEN